MYRAPSPIFDVVVPVPELATLRRVKPLPKRRRTSDPGLDGGGGGGGGVLPTPAGQQPHRSPEQPVLLQHSTEAEEQALAAEPPDPTLAAQMALQAYYMPVLGGVRDLFSCRAAAGGAGAEDGQSRISTPVISIDLNAALAVAGLGTGGGGGGYGGGLEEEEEEDGGDGDYVDHLQQPGNTKKRKVPANMSGSAHGHDVGSGAEDDVLERGGLGAREREGESGAGGGMGAGGGGGTYFGALAGKKGRLSRATLAGLQHKEVLRSRKRQLVSVLGGLTHDTLALDQALSANRLFVLAGVDVRIRLSRRRAARVGRALKAYNESHPRAEQDENKAPSSEFTFVCHSATSDRLVATKEEVAILHSRFGVEFTRQVAKAAEAAKQAAAGSTAAGPVAKRADRTKQVARTGKNLDEKGALEESLLGTPKSKGKKKKRSALANASNPHHLRNYVPSRLPQSGPPSAQQAVQNAQNLLTPLPLRFLSAEVPPRRRKKSEPSVKPITSTLTNPADEWICPFCEYELFYGDEPSYRRAVRKRKKILRRRRRARERAAAAASGVAAAAASGPGKEDERGGPESGGGGSVPKEGVKPGKWKEGDRGGREG